MASVPSTAPGLATSALIGRDDDLRRLRAMLAEPSVRIVTLVGVGGCGKTTLARSIARASTARVVWADLEDLVAPDLLPSAVAAAVDVDPAAGGPPLGVLCGAFGDQATLLVLDGCEHVLDAARELVAHLTSSCPGTQVLLTSHEPLGYPGEEPFAVPPLAVPDPTVASPSELLHVASVQLFLVRASAVDPGFALTAATAGSVARICARVEGLPLAIELLAARLGSMPVEELAALLDGDFDDVGRDGDGHASAVPHPAVRGSIAWTYELLTEPERSVLRRLTVLAGGWTLDLAASVCVDAELCGDAFRRAHEVLERRSLLRAVDGTDGRYRLLEPVRDEARRRLSDEEATAASRRLTSACLSLVREGCPARAWLAPPDSDALQRLAGEHANLVAAIRHAERGGDPEGALELTTRLWTYWRVRGHLSLGRLMTDRLLGSVADDDSQLRTDAQLAAASYAQTAGDLDEAERLVGSVLARCRRLADEAGYGTGLALLANVAAARGDHQRAVTLYRRAAANAERLEFPYAHALVLTNLALAHAELGQLQEARVALERATVLLEEAGDVWFLAYTLTCLGRVARDDRDLIREHGAALRSAELLASHGGGPELAEAIEHVAYVETAFGNTSLSVHLFAAAGRIRTTSGSPRVAGQRGDVDARIAELRDLLGADAFDRSWTAGHRLTTAAVLARARDAVHHAPRRRQQHGRPPSWPLTVREHEVAQALATGLTNREVGEVLHISAATVKTHVEHALAKLGFERRTELAVWAARRRPHRSHATQHAGVTSTPRSDVGR